MSNTQAKKTQPSKVCFAALNPYLDTALPEPVQKEVSGKSYIPYGSDNLYPLYLLGLYEGCSTLKAIIDGNVDYVLGDEFSLDGPLGKDYAAEVLREVIRDWYIYGYGFIQVLRNPLGEVVDLVHLPAEFVRTDKDHQAFWYCEKWRGYGNTKAVVYPAFMREGDAAGSVYMVGSGRGVYPAPIWSAAVKDVEIEKKIEDFHLNELRNNFLSSLLINFNNGTPDDKVKAEIEKAINEKFSGAENAGRIMISFNENVQNRATVDRLSSDSFDTRYQALASRTREQIFIAFKAQPLLFGLTSESNTGFSTTEFGDLFRLYNKTMISPRQDMLRRAMAAIFGREVLTITPFTI